MGADNDTYFGGGRDDAIGTNGLVVQDADVIGGTGNDLITYRLSSNVRVSLDNQFNDGNRGKENVRPDFEHGVFADLIRIGIGDGRGISDADRHGGQSRLRLGVAGEVAECVAPAESRRRHIAKAAVGFDR